MSLLALFRPGANCELSLLSGIKRKLDFEPAQGSFWRKAAVRQYAILIVDAPIDTE